MHTVIEYIWNHYLMGMFVGVTHFYALKFLANQLRLFLHATCLIAHTLDRIDANKQRTIKINIVCSILWTSQRRKLRAKYFNAMLCHMSSVRYTIARGVKKCSFTLALIYFCLAEFTFIISALIDIIHDINLPLLAVVVVVIVVVGALSNLFPWLTRKYLNG